MTGIDLTRSGTKPGLIVDDGSPACAAGMKIAVAVASAAVVAMRVWPFMANSFGSL